MSTMVKIDTKILESTELFRGRRSLGSHKSTMTLYSTNVGNYYFVEWDIPDLGIGEEVGIWVNDAQKSITDYDGISDLPVEMKEFLVHNGFTLPDDEVE